MHYNFFIVSYKRNWLNEKQVQENSNKEIVTPSTLISTDFSSSASNDLDDNSKDDRLEEEVVETKLKDNIDDTYEDKNNVKSSNKQKKRLLVAYICEGGGNPSD